MISEAVLSRAARLGSQKVISASWLLTPITLTRGALRGITMYAGIRRSLAARASACAWLPLLCVHTPLSAASPRRITALLAPRNLNAPTCCRFSHFSSTSLPAMALMSSEDTTGVRFTTPSSLVAADVTSSMLTE